MKFALIVIVSVIATALAQRPWYAGSRPELADRFSDDTDSTRPSSSYPYNYYTDYYNTPPRGVPVEAHGDVSLVDWLRQWPRQNQPFWLVNADQIEAQRGTQRYAAPAYGYDDSYYPYAYRQNYGDVSNNLEKRHGYY